MTFRRSWKSSFQPIKPLSQWSHVSNISKRKSESTDCSNSIPFFLSAVGFKTFDILVYCTFRTAVFYMHAVYYMQMILFSFSTIVTTEQAAGKEPSWQFWSWLYLKGDRGWRVDSDPRPLPAPHSELQKVGMFPGSSCFTPETTFVTKWSKRQSVNSWPCFSHVVGFAKEGHEVSFKALGII